MSASVKSGGAIQRMLPRAGCEARRCLLCVPKRTDDDLVPRQATSAVTTHIAINLEIQLEVVMVMMVLYVVRNQK